MSWWALAVVAVVVGLASGALIARMAGPNGLPQGSPGSGNSSSGVFTRERGQVAPLWHLPDLQVPTRTLALSQFGGHPVVLNFWASSCTACVGETPMLEKVARLLGKRVQFVGIDTLDQRAGGVHLAASDHLTYPLATDNAQVYASYGVFGLPTTFFISPSGFIVGKQIGALTQGRLLSIIHKLFGVTATRG
ncbi:MAG: TlpA family protein disulfide reductase [Acidimicrobiales bacterium]